MYSIGEIAKIVQVSVDTLRYYDEIDLLKPCYIQEENRYRYYSKDQLNDLVFILEMKSYGFSLDAIRELLACQDPSRIEQALQGRIRELSVEQHSFEKTLQRITHKLQQLSDKEDMPPTNTVLIVDDVAFMRMVLRDIVEKHGYIVLGEAATAQEGVDLCSQMKPDFVIMDLHFAEGMDGIHATRHIRRLHHEARIIICSARGSIENILLSIHNGAQAFVVKPFQAEYLLEAVSALSSSKDTPKWDIPRVRAWLADDRLRSRCSSGTLDQVGIQKLFHLCSQDVVDADERLMELILEYEQVTNPITSSR